MSTTTEQNVNAPALAPKKQQLTLRGHLEGDAFKNAVAAALPRHLTPDRFIRIAITAMNRVPKLKDCTESSFLNALLTLSQYGLEPDGRRAHLIPYKNAKLSQAAGRDVYDCQLIIDWKGLSELIYRSGLVSTLHADVVREGDIFEYSMGVLAKHVPHYLRRDADKPTDAGDVFAAYAMATMRDGARKTEVMSEEQIEDIRKRSKAGNAGPWITDRAEMAKKTVFRRLSKWLPLSAELRDAIEKDDDRPADLAKNVTGTALSLTEMMAIPEGDPLSEFGDGDEQTKADLAATREKGGAS